MNDYAFIAVFDTDKPSVFRFADYYSRRIPVQASPAYSSRFFFHSSELPYAALIMDTMDETARPKTNSFRSGLA
jgi:hypothetical protein